jgi:general stress protein 26
MAVCLELLEHELESGGGTITMANNREEIEKIIINFLGEHGETYFTCALATCWNNEPRNTPVDARNDGLTMYFVSDLGKKLENMKKNPKVCLAVFMPVGKGYMKNARGLQMWGTVKILTMQESPEEFKKGAEVIRIDEISATVSVAPLPDEVKATLNIIKVVPSKIAYFDSTGDKPVKHIWEAQTADRKLDRY